MRRIIMLATAGVLAVGGAGTAYAAMSAPGPDYRLAVASPAHVTATLSATGTVQPAHQASVAFAVSGTVSSVAVHAGQHVTAGQVLGSLDPTSLRAALTQAQSALARANLTVHNDLSSQDTSISSVGASGPSQPPVAEAAGGQLRTAQQAVIAAQRAADSALAAAKAGVAQASRSCATPPSPVSPSPSAASHDLGAAGRPAPSASRTASPPPGPVPPPSGSPSPSLSPSPASCLAATQRAVRVEGTALHAEQLLAGSLTGLGKILAQSAGAASGGGDAVEAAGPRRGGSGGGADGGSGAVSAAQLAADQAAADAAAAQVAVAEADLANATVRSPAAGTVITASVTAGASVSAGDAAFLIAGLDSYEVTADVPVTSLPQLRDGLRASVVPDGGHGPVAGTVTSIGLQPDATSPSVTYPVTISLDGPVSDLHAGTLAAVTITTARGSGVSVPTSAVHYAGKKATVLVDAGGSVRAAKVTVGTKGPVLTQIIAGLRAGQQVVLANLNAPLPTAQS